MNSALAVQLIFGTCPVRKSGEVTIETLLCIRRSVLGATALNSFSVWGSILSFSFTVIAGSICDNVRKG